MRDNLNDALETAPEDRAYSALERVRDAYNQGPDPRKVRDAMDGAIDYVREALDTRPIVDADLLDTARSLQVVLGRLARYTAEVEAHPASSTGRVEREKAIADLLIYKVDLDKALESK